MSIKKLCIFFAIAIFIYVLEQNYAKILDYKVNVLDKEYKKLADENNSLKIKRESILSIETMDRISKEKNLKKPYDASVINLDR
ncbi:MAG: hypothetical protein LBC07_01590 [Elusimicrobiota bacterium]|nr:hypothetical protein [Elusimicrobiota bacterium]